MAATIPQTREGLHWTAAGITKGLRTQAVIPSSTAISSSYDAIVVSAGFAGLTAARELSRSYNKSVLIIEARDRIGGRTWTANLWNDTFEMGGNWIHWWQPHAWTELVRYGLHRDIVTSTGPSSAEKAYLTMEKGKCQAFGDMQAIGDLEKIPFFNADGLSARELMPCPFDPFKEPALWKKYDQLSVRDRLEQIEGLDEMTRHILEGVTVGVGLLPADQTPFVLALQWYATGGYSFAGLAEIAGWFKIGNGGMTKIARCILNDFAGDILMDSPVAAFTEDASGKDVTVTLANGRKLTAAHVISTIPINVLPDVTISPALPDSMAQALSTGQLNRGSKWILKLSPATQPWIAMSKVSPAEDLPWTSALSDHNSHNSNHDYAVAFGVSDALPDPDLSKENADSIPRLFKQTFGRNDAPQELDAYLMHNWATDPYAKGAWACWPVGGHSVLTPAMQQAHMNGRLLFASADWAEGGYSNVDGAIEQGFRAARVVAGELPFPST